MRPMIDGPGGLRIPLLLDGDYQLDESWQAYAPGDTLCGTRRCTVVGTFEEHKAAVCNCASCDDEWCLGARASVEALQEALRALHGYIQ